MRTKAFLVLLALALSSVATLGNHHSFSAYFDQFRPVVATGTIVKVDWVNPAVFIHLRVDDNATGQSTMWAFEGQAGPNGMKSKGVTGDLFKEGDQLTIVAFMGKPDTNLSETVADPILAARVKASRFASIAQFEFPDGRRLPVVDYVPPISR
jgi:hypothetical protein